MIGLIKELFDKNKKIAVAVSGGVDSMTLLHMTGEASGGRSFLAFTVNHHIREDAAKDALFVVRYCVKNNIEVRLYNVFATKETSGEGVEAAARKLRRKIYQRILEEYDYVLLAHNANDNAESVLMHILRGAGLNGAGGMRAFDEKSRIIRPLIDTTRKEIEEYSSQNSVSYVFDKTNAEDNYTRNYLRNRVFPLLERVNTGFVDNINAFAKRAQKDGESLNTTAEKLINTSGVAEKPANKTADCASLDLAAFVSADSAIQARAIYLTLGKIGVFEDIEERHVVSVRNFVQNAKNGSEIMLPGGVGVLKNYDSVIFFKADEILGAKNARKAEQGRTFGLGEHNFERITVRIDECGGVNDYLAVFKSRDKTGLSPSAETDKNKDFIATKAYASGGLYLDNGLGGTGLCLNVRPLFFDVDTIPGDAVIRFRSEGDRFVKFGGVGKKLKDYFIDKKISGRLRGLVPLVCVDGEVLAVCGIEISERLKITEKTARIGKITVCNCKDNKIY